MRLTTRRHRGERMELSMTSMIDVVFLLLIFFVVTTTFVRPERQVQSAIKVNERRDAQSRSNLEPAIVDVSRVNDTVTYRLGVLQTTELAEIQSVLREFEDKTSGAFVRPADNVPFEAAAQAIGACRASGFASVSYLPSASSD